MTPEKPAPIMNQYIHLAGTTRDRSSNVPRLYLGPNHLLIMQLKSTRETARRFYYSDITALRCHPTRLGYFIDGAFVAVAAFFWLYYLAAPGAEIGHYFVAVAASVIAGIALLSNGMRGPTCKTWLHTANHTERLSSLGRYNTAQRALAKLHERIVEAQEARYEGSLEVERSFEPYAPPAISVRETILRPHDARWMKSAFLVSLISSLQGCLDFFYGDRVLDAVELWTALASAGLGTAAIVHSYGTNCPALARRMCAWLLASTTLSIPIVLAAMAFLALNGEELSGSQRIIDLAPRDGLQFFVQVGLHTGMLLFDATCALIGLRALVRHADRSIVKDHPE